LLDRYAAFYVAHYYVAHLLVLMFDVHRAPDAEWDAQVGRMFYNQDMKKTIIVELPGYVTVAGAADRLRLAPRSVRDLIYTGRLPSARLGRRHFLKLTDVEAERRRRLGLPLPRRRPVARHRQAPRRPSETQQPPRHVDDKSAVQASAARSATSEARRERARQREAALERWMRSGHAGEAPRLPFKTVELEGESSRCDACQRPVRPGGRMMDAAENDAHSAARLCLTCARRTVLAWSDRRRREAVAARRLAQELGPTYTPLLEPANAAA